MNEDLPLSGLSLFFVLIIFIPIIFLLLFAGNKGKEEGNFKFFRTRDLIIIFLMFLLWLWLYQGPK